MVSTTPLGTTSEAVRRHVPAGRMQDDLAVVLSENILATTGSRSNPASRPRLDPRRAL